jgi:hypothetical protein
MTIEDVVKELGAPQRRTANALEYTKAGFAVLPGKDKVVRIVMGGDVMGLNGPLVEAFKGRTKEGIGMKSTREEVVKAYGQPTEVSTFPGGSETLLYSSLGMTFILEAGKVHHMAIRLDGTNAPDRTITLPPPPADPATK